MIPALLLIAAVEAPAPSCITQAQAISTVSELGGEVVGSAHYQGMVTTDMLIVQLPDMIVMFGFSAVGCFVGQITIERVAPETPA